MQVQKISVGVGRKVNDGNYGSYDFYFSAEATIGPDENPVEEYEKLYGNLQGLLGETMLNEGIVTVEN